MKFSYAPTISGSLESLGNNTNNPNVLLGRLDSLPGGKTIDINLGCERPLSIEPRLMPITDLKILSQESEPFILQELVPLITTGKPYSSDLRFLRQNFEGRSRSLEVENPENNNWVSIAGFGLMVERQMDGEERKYHVYKPFNQVTLREMDYHNIGPDSLKIGNAIYQNDGTIEFTGGRDPAGGYIYDVLGEKIGNSLIADSIIQNTAITPKWLMSARLEGEFTKESKAIGLGAYELPPNILEVNLAEISEYLRLNGVENTIYERFIFDSNRALLALADQDYVHLQPHMGNVMASLTDDFKPIIKDFTTLTDISGYSKVPMSKLGDFSPYTMNILQDMTILNKGLLRSKIQIRDFENFPHKDKSLNLLPSSFKKPISGPEYFNFLANQMAWVTAGRLAPIGTFPSRGTIETYTEMLLPKIINIMRQMKKPSDPENDLDYLIQFISGSLILGNNPVTSYDMYAADFVDKLKSNYKAQEIRKKR